MKKQHASGALVPEGYQKFLWELKQRIQQAQLHAVLSVNRELVLLYWQIGQDILARQDQAGWGAKIIDQLSKDLHQDFPDMAGFSPRNLKYMRAFAEAWPEESIVQQAAAQLPWFHNCVLLDKVKNVDERLWYIQQTVANGWSRNVLVMQIETGLYRRQGKALTNFAATLPAPQSDLAQQMPGGTFYDTFAAADIKYGTMVITGIQLVDDSGYAFPTGQTVLIDNTQINSSVF